MSPHRKSLSCRREPVRPHYAYFPHFDIRRQWNQKQCGGSSLNRWRWNHRACDRWREELGGRCQRRGRWGVEGKWKEGWERLSETRSSSFCFVFSSHISFSFFYPSFHVLSLTFPLQFFHLFLYPFYSPLPALLFLDQLLTEFALQSIALCLPALSLEVVFSWSVRRLSFSFASCFISSLSSLTTVS